MSAFSLIDFNMFCLMFDGDPYRAMINLAPDNKQNIELDLEMEANDNSFFSRY